jgi:hypothetical protein
MHALLIRLGAARVRTAVVIALVAAAAGTVFSQKAAPSPVTFPESYREWVHVKSALVSARHPDFQRSGGFRHIYANPKAAIGYKTGTFPEGSEIVVDWIDAPDTDGMFSEGATSRVDVMVKDATRFAATRGWGFERFTGAGRTRTVTDVDAQCAKCHSGPNARDMVFSKFRP